MVIDRPYSFGATRASVKPAQLRDRIGGLMHESKFRLKPRSSTKIVLPWLLSLALTVSPVIAQDASTRQIKIVQIDKDDALELARQRVLREPTAEREPNGTPILFDVPPSDTVAKSTFPGRGVLPQSAPPGKKDKGIIIAILGGIGAAILLAMLLGGDDDPEDEATILTPGTPTVNTP